MHESLELDERKTHAARSRRPHDAIGGCRSAVAPQNFDSEARRHPRASRSNSAQVRAGANLAGRRATRRPLADARSESMKPRIGSLGFLGIVLLMAGCSGAGESNDSTPQSAAAAESVVTSTPCASSSQCGASTHCSTEDGVCNRPPGCGPGDICPDICYGTCTLSLPGVKCGSNVCGKGQHCCNASCGTCAPPGGVCTQQVCTPQN
jgi:hypothetical protein